MDLKLSNKYKHLFDRPKGVDTYVITGGRFSQKSFAVGTASVHLSIHKEHRILYGRYTSVSTKDSTFPEVEEKINLLEYENYFNISQNRIDCNLNESKISRFLEMYIIKLNKLILLAFLTNIQS